MSFVSDIWADFSRVGLCRVLNENSSFTKRFTTYFYFCTEMRIPILIILCLLVSAFAAPIVSNTLTNAVYSFSKPNDKNFVYVEHLTPLSVTVDVTSWATGYNLSLSFFTESGDSLPVVPTSNCVDSANSDVFVLDQGALYPKSAINALTTCTFSATITASTFGQVYTKLSVSAEDTLPAVASFTTSTRYFSAYWSYNLLGAGDANMLTMSSAIDFKKGDSFFITASNGSPFATATACRDGQGTEIFSVSAQGSRLLFSARQDLSGEYECSVNMSVGPTNGIDLPYTFTMPLHGITGTLNGFMCFLNREREGFHLKSGLAGPMVFPTTPNTAVNTLYLAIPASTLQAGDTIRVHLNSYNVILDSCMYKNGAQAGKFTLRNHREGYLGSDMALSLTLASPLQVSEQKMVELLCPITIPDPMRYRLSFSGVSVPQGIFSATSLQFDSEYPEMTLFDEYYHANLVSFGEKFTTFTFMANKRYGAFGYLNADFRIDGVTITDASEVMNRCSFFRDNERTPLETPMDIVSVFAGRPQIRINSKMLELAELEYIYITCQLTPTVGSTVVLYDNINGRVLAQDTVHQATTSLTFGDNIQTHYMSANAADISTPIPFTIDVANLYSQSFADKFNHVNIRFEMYDKSLVFAQDMPFTCESGSASVESFSSDISSVLSVTIENGHSAKCSGFAHVSYLSGDAINNYVRVAMVKYVSAHLFHSIFLSILSYAWYSLSNDPLISSLLLHLSRPGDSSPEAYANVAYSNIVTMPNILSQEDFSFRIDNFKFAQTVTLAIGHRFIPTSNTFSFTFDQMILTAGAACVANDVQILTCSVSKNGDSLDCQKVSAEEEIPCTMSIHFANDFSRAIAVTASFPDLPSNVVFQPSFKVQGQTTYVYGVIMPNSPTYVGQETFFKLDLPRPPRPSDEVKIRINGDSVGTLHFLRFEPHTASAAGAVREEDGYLYIPLTNVNVTEVTSNNLKLIFMHVVAPGGYDAQSTVAISFSLVENDNFLGSVSLVFQRTPLYIKYVSSKNARIAHLLRIDHPNLAVDDSITVNDLSLPADSNIELRCDGTTPTNNYTSGAFVLTAAVDSYSPCYVIFQSYPINKPYWSVSVTIGGITTNIYHAAWDTVAPGFIAQSHLVKDSVSNFNITIPEFTTSFIGNSAQFTFKYDTTKMKDVTCNCGGTVASVNTETGDAVVTFTAGTWPLAWYSTLQCAIMLTPLAAGSFAFTNVQVFGANYDNIALPPVLDALVPSVRVDFPYHFSTLQDSHEVQFTIDQMPTADGDTIELISSLSPFLTFESCNAGNITDNKIVWNYPHDAMDAAVTFTCFVRTEYESNEPVAFTIRYNKFAGGMVEFPNFSAPPSLYSGMIIEKIATTVNTVQYKATIINLNSGVEPYAQVVTFYPTGDGKENVSLESDCSGKIEENVAKLVFSTTALEPRASCVITVVFKAAYEPRIATNPLRISSDYENVLSGDFILPAVAVPAPAIMASISSRRISLYIVYGDANTVSIDNVWGVRILSTDPIKIYDFSETPVEVGQVVTSADGRTLIASFIASFVTVNSGKYSIPACYFDLPSLRNDALFSIIPHVKFAVGGSSRTIRISEYTSYRADEMYADAKLTPGSTYEVAWRFAMAANKGSIVFNYGKSALASVVSCHASSTGYFSDFTLPVEFTVSNSVLSIALTPDMLDPESSVSLAVQCVFNTVSESDMQKKVGPYAKTIPVSIIAENGLELFTAPLTVAVPYAPPRDAVRQAVRFPRSTLFSSSELANLARAYAAGLRKSISGLTDDQVAVSEQKLVSLIEAADVVSSPIVTQFQINAADTAVSVTFTTTSTTSVSVTSTLVQGASGDLTNAFTGYTVTPTAAGDTVVDGECATRCGLGCALCAQGEVCSTNADCVESNCNSSGVCGAESTPNGNAASSAHISLTLLIALIMFLNL